MPSDPSVFESIARRKHLDSAVLPIFADGHECSGVEGSGCLFELEGQLFLVTAAHVAQIIEVAPERVGIPDAPGKGACTTVGRGQMAFTKSEETDVGVFRFDETKRIKELRESGFRILGPQDVHAGVPNPRTALSFGWPVAGSSMVGNTLHVAPIAMELAVTSIGPLFIDLEWPNADDVPQLQGISGSPFWSVVEPGNIWTPESELKLLGIEHTIKKGHYVRGTRWSVVERVVRSLLT